MSLANLEVTAFGKLLIGLFAAYHLYAGVILLAPWETTRKIASRLYKMRMPEVPDPRYALANKFLGLYALHVAAAGVLAFACGGQALLAALIGFCLLTIGRLVARSYYAHQLETAFGIPVPRQTGKNALNFAILVAIVTFCMQKG